MKRFYLAVPISHEDVVLKKIGELGIAQLTTEVPIDRSEMSEEIGICRRFIGLYERINILLADFPSEKPSEKALKESGKADYNQVRSLVDQAETNLNETSRQIEALEAEIKTLKADGEKLEVLKTYGLEVIDVGDFRYVFVKVGFLSNILLAKFGAYVNGTSVVCTSRPGRPRESFVVVAGLNEDKTFVENILKALNFEELVFPNNLNPRPELALQEIRIAVESRERGIKNFKNELTEVKRGFDSVVGYVNYTLQVEEAKNSVARTKSRSLIYGWIPSNKIGLFQTQIEQVVPREQFSLKFENPNPDDKVPVQVETKGLLGAFGLFTHLQGTPDYFEINPTPIYLLLYVLMFGMMFGDIGDGVLLILIGFALTRMKKSFLSFSVGSLQKLGRIVVTCGVVTIFFGFLYGEMFVTEIFPPLLFSPIHDITRIITIALVFGAVQLTLALSLNITNKIRRNDLLGAIFSGRGVVGLSFYLSGVVLAITFIRELTLSVFLQQDMVPFTFITVISLVLVLFSPVLKASAGRRKAKVSERLIEGFGEGLETFITSLSNSVSYIRLAAFAIAHGALGLASVILASTLGNAPSLILINVMVFVVEGFAAFIQSLRLMYYEFSTKFFVGNGVQFKPFELRGTK